MAEKQPFRNEPAAHALFDGMIGAMRAAQTLYFESRYNWEGSDDFHASAVFRTWLRKPNSFRVEGMREPGGAPVAVLVGDGDAWWLYWTGDRPQWHVEDDEAYEASRQHVYMTEPTPLGRHSIGHSLVYNSVDASMPIVDPSTFHGYTDSLQPYLDGVRGAGCEDVGGEGCRVVDVSFMRGQRTWRVCLARDGLPRLLGQVSHVSSEIRVNERWLNVAVDAAMPDDLFEWTPPPGWREWRMPGPQARLLKPGTPAPDFCLQAAGGGTLRLSDFRGRVVWLNFWRCG